MVQNKENTGNLTTPLLPTRGDRCGAFAKRRNTFGAAAAAFFIKTFHPKSFPSFQSKIHIFLSFEPISFAVLVYRSSSSGAMNAPWPLFTGSIS